MVRASQSIAPPPHPVDSHYRTVDQRHADIRFTAFLAGLLAFAFAGMSCEESLPSYQEPKSILNGWVRGEFQSVTGQAIPQFWIYLGIENGYEETLQGKKRLTGTFEVVLRRAPEYRKTFTLDQTYAIYPYLLRYQSTPTITIDSGDSLLFMYPWDLYDDRGIFLPDAVFVIDTVQRTALPEDFDVSGSFQVFDNTGQVVIAPTKCTLYYRVPARK